jgi:hypothetical protein
MHLGFVKHKKADNESSSISASSQLPSTSGNAKVPKRKGDVEFELHNLLHLQKKHLQISGLIIYR